MLIPADRAGAVAKSFLKGEGEMGKVLKTHRMIDICDLLFFSGEFMMGQIQPFLRQPLPGCIPEYFFKI